MKPLQKRIIRNTQKTIAATNTTISEAVYNGQRAVLVLKNISTAGEIISLAIGQEATNGFGLVLKQGETLTLAKDSGYNPANQIINAIDNGAGTGVLSIYEEIEV